MILQTKGLRLDRSPQGDWNERVRFFTKDYGVLTAHSFGSKGPASTRGALLSTLDWLEISLEKRGSQWRLLGLSLWQKNPVFRGEEDPTWFLEGLQSVLDASLHEVEQEPLFHLVRLISLADWGGVPMEIRKDIFLIGVLGIHGLWTGLPSLEGSPTSTLHSPVFSLECGPEWARLAALMLLREDLAEIKRSRQIWKRTLERNAI